MKIFISQPMKDKSEEEIINEREKAINILNNLYGEENVEIIDSKFKDHEEYLPLECLSKSLNLLAKADLAVFLPGYDSARGCRIEFKCAFDYGINILILSELGVSK